MDGRRRPDGGGPGRIVVTDWGVSTAPWAPTPATRATAAEGHGLSRRQDHSWQMDGRRRPDGGGPGRFVVTDWGVSTAPTTGNTGDTAHSCLRAILRLGTRRPPAARIFADVGAVALQILVVPDDLIEIPVLP